MINRAFSLIELMVVVAIIAVLASIAVPAFQSFYARGQVSAALPIVQGIMQYLQQYYATNGAFPTTITIGGTTFATSAITGGFSAGWSAVNLSTGNISNVYYMISSDGQGTGIGINFTSLNIPGFTAGIGGGYSSMFFAMRSSNGIFTTVCGGNGAGGVSSTVPFQYMPSTCSCAFIGAGYATGYINTGTGC